MRDKVTNKKRNKKRGVGLLEVVISVSLLFLFVVSIATAIQFLLKASIDNTDALKAAYLLEEGVEAVRIMRDSDWTGEITGLSGSTNYYLVFQSGNYTTSETSVLIDGRFDRYFTIEDVDRDSEDEIVSSGTDDPNTKKIIMNVSYLSRGATTTKSIESYIHNSFDN